MPAFLALAAPLVALRGVLLIARHVPMGHDTFQYLQLQYNFFNEAALGSSTPFWLPFMTHGTVATVWFFLQQSLLLSLLHAFAPLFEGVNFLYLYHAALLFDELILLLGTLLLARLYYRSLFAAVFVAAAVTFTAVSTTQIWFDFHLFYLLPLLLYAGSRAVLDGRARYLFLAGVFLAATTLGNLIYFAPVTLFVVFVFAASHLVFATPGAVRATVRRLRARLSWRHVPAIAIPAALAVAALFFVRYGTDEIVYSNVGRGPGGEVVSVDDFLTYGGQTDVREYVELISRYTNQLDNTIYVGFLVLPFALFAALRCRSRASYAVGTAALVLALFGAATLVSVGFYFIFPLGSFFRHIGLTTTIPVIFLALYAGFGVDAFLAGGRSARTGAAAAAAGAAALMFALVAAWRLGVLDPPLTTAWTPSPGVHIPTDNQPFLDAAEIAGRLTWLLAIGAAATLALLAGLRRRWRVPSVYLLLAVHLVDVGSYKAELELRLAPSVPAEVVSLFELGEYDFSPQRSQDYRSSPRFRALEPFLFSERDSQSLNIPHQPIGRYGATYWNTESFLYFDAQASIFRDDHWLRGVDVFHRAFVPAEERVSPRHLGFPIPAAEAYAKASGFEFPKLQLFSSIRVLPSDAAVASALAAEGYTGDLLLTSLEGVETPAAIPASVRGPDGKLPLLANERIPDAALEVEAFDFNTLRVRVDSGRNRPSVLYYADAWHSHWRARVNGEPAPVIRANLAYKAVVVPPGESVVEFKFGNATYRGLSSAVLVTGALAASGALLLVGDLPA